MTLDLDSENRFVQPVETAAAINNYNEVIENDGNGSDFLERSLFNLDRAGARAIARIVDGDFLLDEKSKIELACYISFQFFRIPRQREHIDKLSDYLLKADIAVAGPDSLRKSEEAQGRTYSDEEFNELWKSILAFDEYTIAQHQNEKIKISLEMAQEFIPMFSRRGWALVRFERKALATSDAPVTLYMWPEHREGLTTVGLFNADEIWFPLSRHCALMMSQYVEEGMELVPTAKLANVINQRTIAFADRWLYFHPEDDPIKGLELVRATNHFTIDGLTPQELAKRWEVKLGGN